MHPALRLLIIMRPIMYAWRNQKVSGMVFLKHPDGSATSVGDGSNEPVDVTAFTSLQTPRRQLVLDII